MATAQPFRESGSGKMRGTGWMERGLALKGISTELTHGMSVEGVFHFMNCQVAPLAGGS